MTENSRKEEIYDIVKEILVKSLGIDEKKVQLKANIVDDLGADSLDSVEVIIEIEERFNIAIPDEDAISIKTVQDLVDYIEKKN